MIRWTDTTLATILADALHQGRHRQPRIVVDRDAILDDYADDFHRHAIVDGRTVDDALTLAEIDASDRMTIAEAAS